ncbi:hypothetical protein OPT61_g3945 [Boeremia exigua]|uniref:Uncharacterized protein n=1 Tax=Boeremia exigua TaxID=749465 RepID=A0ACC2IFY9_9PLEO|nr:hypothetical protein OPT61_g3945 [Boeremia exigua]
MIRSIPSGTHELAPNSSCPLLSLPGELRNRIYDYCVESGLIVLPPAVHRYAPSFPCFGGLRYASKTLYIEFTPIYLKRTIVSIHPSDIERYLSVVYPKQQHLPNDTPSVVELKPNTCGRIRIDLRLSEALDLTPFAGLWSRAPNIRIEFARSSALNAVMGNITDLLKALMNASCCFDFERVVERILFRHSLRSEVVIKLQRGVLLDDLFDETMHRSPRQWLTWQGLPVLDHLKIVMESSEGVLRDPPAGADRPVSLYQTKARTLRGVV